MSDADAPAAPETQRNPHAEPAPEKRTYPQAGVAGRPQGPGSPGASEPGAMGADDEARAAPPRENLAENGGSGCRGA